MLLTPGTRLGTYEIIEHLGAGGMGVVYRARDEKLQRDVALKLLAPALMADTEARRRLTREARALSQLNHPNIATVYALDSDESTDFIVMEWVPGQTLDERVAAGPLAEAEVVRLATQTAEALIAAHAANVAHRDLKPANLRVTPEGRLKVLDFGLARRTSVDEAAPTMTAAETESTGGTLAYMPPEAFAGQAGDAQGDLWSLGVVLYELITGQRPFAGKNVAQTVNAVLHQPIAPPRTVHAAVSPGLQTIIMRLLQRDREQRYPSAEALHTDLTQLRDGGSPAAQATARPSIAVLPLVNLSGDSAQEYFADGMTEALIGDLARVRELRVISRTSVMRYKGAQQPIPEIAAELGVEAILEGSVLRGGDRVRVSVQLIEANSDTHLWAERYDRSIEDVLALQTDVADAVVREIRVALLKEPPAPTPAPVETPSGTRLPHPPDVRRVDPRVYDLYLRGRHQLNRRSDESLQRAVGFFQQAVEQDGEYALAHVAMGEAHALLGFHEFGAPGATFPLARVAANRALEIDPGLGEAHATLGYIQMHYDWDWTIAERSFLRALELGPNQALTHLWYANLLIAAGRHEETQEQIQRALELDPLSLVHNVVEGWGKFFERKYEDAFHKMERGLELEPDFFPAHQWRGWALALAGHKDEAARHLRSASELIHHEPISLHCRALAHAFSDEVEEGQAVVAKLEQLRSERHVSAFSIAITHVALGDHARGMDWLEAARDERAHWIGYLNLDGRVDPLRGNPRFEAVRALVGKGSAS